MTSNKLYKASLTSIIIALTLAATWIAIAPILISRAYNGTLDPNGLIENIPTLTMPIIITLFLLGMTGLCINTLREDIAK